MYTAIVSLIHSNAPKDYEAKEIIEVLDIFPILRPPQLKFWNWISDYYLASIGDVYQVAVPTGLKIESETQVVINPNFEQTEYTVFTDTENQLLSILSDGKIHSVNELNRLVEVKNIINSLKLLFVKNAIEISEELTKKYKPKTETFVRLNEKVKNDEELQQIFTELERAKKQLEILMKYLELSKFLAKKEILEVSKKEVLEKSNNSASAFNSLIEKEVLEVYQKEIGRLDVSEIHTEPISELNSYQQKAYAEINEQFQHKNTVLLHGVTSSGKTEIYIHLINKCLREKKQVLYLVPEIALTTQLTNRLRKVFGNKLGIYHSKFSDAERVEIWNNLLLNKEYEIIIGVRSS
ncbi:MAG: primosomal protein N', partial [Paludibacter sp.]